jgi:RND family efflux transporter MFP subunit
MNPEAPESIVVSPNPTEPVASPGERIESSARQLNRGLGRVARRFDWRVTSLLLLALVAIPVWRAVSLHAKPKPVMIEALPVAVAKVTREDLSQDLVCDAELRPYQEIDLHSKVAGFLQKIHVDIGDRVEAGQALASIEVPELQDDIRGAEAAQKRCREEVARAEAAAEEAHQVYSRMAAVNRNQPNLIAQQELDAAQARDRTTASALGGAKAEVDVSQAQVNKLLTMLKYSQITAPFAGIITKRYADPGALIQAGTSSSTQTLPVVRLSQNDRLRLDIPVSVSYVSRVNVGDPVEIRVASFAAPLRGTIARSTRKVETATRTMEVEVDVPNADLRLIPGMYASVSLRLEHREKTLVVPIEAVSRQKTSTVLVVDRDGKIQERTISLGLETPRKIEVLTGLYESDLVMIGSRSQVKPGQKVEPKLIALTSLE